MASEPTADARLRAAEEALRKVQAQAAALEELSEQLSLAVHVLEAEMSALGEQQRELLSRLDAGQPGGGSDEPLESPARSSDAEGARLVALNMALEGQPREDAGRYLAEHFDIPDREALLDDVYAAAGR